MPIPEPTASDFARDREKDYTSTPRVQEAEAMRAALRREQALRNLLAEWIEDSDIEYGIDPNVPEESLYDRTKAALGGAKP